MIHLLKLEQMKFLVWSWQQKTAYKYKHKPIEHLRTAVNWASPLGVWVTSRLAIVAIVTSQNQMYLLFNLTALHLNWYQMLVNSCVLSATRWRRWAPTGWGVQARPTGRWPWSTRRCCWSEYIYRLAWKRLIISPDKLEEVAGEREVWASLLKLLPPRPNFTKENG